MSNNEVQHITDHPRLTSIIQKMRLVRFDHYIGMDESAVPQSDWKRLATSSHLLAWLATIKNDLSVEDATKLALDRPLWRLLAASRAMH